MNNVQVKTPEEAGQNVVEMKPKESLLQYINKKQDVIKSRLKVNGLGMDWVDYANDVCNAVSENEDLKRCSHETIFNASMQLCKAGLSIGGNMGWLVPFGGKCTFQIGYQGYVLMLHRCRPIKKMATELLYEGDAIVDLSAEEYCDENGLKRTVKFRVTRGSNFGNKNKIKGAYSYFEFTDGQQYFKEMAKEEIGKSSKSSATIWNGNAEVMHKKQALKMHARDILKFSTPPNMPNILEVLNDEENEEIKENAKDITPQTKPDVINEDRLQAMLGKKEAKVVVPTTEEQEVPAEQSEDFTQETLI